MTERPHRVAQLSFYRASLAALQFVEGRRATGRRFGVDADARWNGFKGDLTTADRIDLLVRDADAEWPGSFGPRTAFGLRAVAEDEPFGAEWEPLEAVSAEEVWRAALKTIAPSEARGFIDQVARIWEIELRWPSLPPIAANDRLVLVGPGAIAAAIVVFSLNAGLDWAAQVTCLASPPSHRYLAGLAGAIVNLAKPSQIISPTDDLQTLQSATCGYASRDAAESDLSAAVAALGERVHMLEP